MASQMISIILFFQMLFNSKFYQAKAETLIRVGYWESSQMFPISAIDSDLFTHLIFAYASINSTSYQLSLSPSDEYQLPKFTEMVKQKNPSITTLLSIGGNNTNYSTLSSMVGNSSYRKSFIDSSIRLARLYGFQGLDFSWTDPNKITNMSNMGNLFEEWRAATESEAKISSDRHSQKSQLILTAKVNYSPENLYPVNSIQRNLNWVHVLTAEYYTPLLTNFTAAHAALYGSSSFTKNTDQGIKAWIEGGLSADKLVLCLPFYGHAWTLVNPKENGIGAPATGSAFYRNGLVRYKEIKNYIKQYGASNNVHVMYNSTYVVNYISIGNNWFGFDDVEAIRVKISYTKEKRLLGYFVWAVSFDDYNWVLSRAAAQKDRIAPSTQVKNNKDGHSNWRLLVLTLSIAAAAAILLLCFCIYHNRLKKLKLKRTEDSTETSNKRAKNVADAGDFNRNVPNLKVYSFSDIEVATEEFSARNKLGEGGYGPVYKGVLPDGQVIAVKKLSKTSTQGFEEFKNEVMLTAKLQHVNLVRVLGFCIEREEPMLIYEYMPNKSLDCYLFDPIRRLILNWRKRVIIIEGIIQGLLYLQEYSRFTIIHRDLKASNVLLNEDMKPKISDFGMARIFIKESLEANTEQIVGTIGYIPPEYAHRGVYSTKSDVYSFGILLLQIISGKRLSTRCGVNENLGLQEYGYELWKEGNGREFVDPILEDKDSSCKLMRCLQIALLCVQENPNDRPSMLEVSSMLKNGTTNINTPKKPAFSKQADEIKEDEQNKSTTQLEICSSYDVSVSEVVPR